MLTLLIAGLTTSFAATETVPTPTTIEAFSNWDLLGKKKVNFRLEKDVIPVTIVQGLYTAIKLKVKGNDINMHQLIIHFENGTTQRVRIRKNIPDGGSTREIQLTGAGRRVIEKITMLYDKETRADDATVSVWGKH